MKTKTILILGAAVGLCVTAVLWHRSAPIVPESASTSSDAHEVSGPASHQAAHRTVESARHARAAANSLQPASPIDSARLIGEIQDGFVSTNLETIEFALTNLLPSLVTLDPLAAAHLAETLTEPDQRADVLRRVAQLWAAQDSTAALGWAAALFDAGERDTTLTDVCLQMARSNPADAVRARDQFVPEGKPSGALDSLVQIWAEKDFTTALAWTLSRTKNEQRDGLIARLAFIQSQTASADAATLAAEKMIPGEAQNEAVISVLHQWALRDPASASAWVERFPECPLRERALLELAGIASYRTQSNAP